MTVARGQTPDGPLSREGGQYTIWLSQVPPSPLARRAPLSLGALGLRREVLRVCVWGGEALAAKGDRAQALLTVRTLRSHED
eukprot:3679200-Rhodomonas_salina.1